MQKKMPRAVKRKRRVVTEDGIDAGMEEYLVRSNSVSFSLPSSLELASVFAATFQSGSLACCCSSFKCNRGPCQGTGDEAHPASSPTNCWE